MKIAITATMIAVLVLFCFIGSCGLLESPPDPNKYVNYVCHDYHLTCLDTYKKSARTSITRGNVNYYVSFKKPVGESDEQFVCGTVSTFLGFSSNKRIFQPAEDYIEVYRDWTIKKIELFIQYFDDDDVFDNDEFAEVPSKVLSFTTDTTVFNELTDFVTNPEYSKHHKYQEGVRIEKLHDYEYRLYIRVHFNESDTIVWDAQVYSYIFPQAEQRRITIDKGQPDDYVGKGQRDVFIDDFPNLLNWISSSIDALKKD